MQVKRKSGLMVQIDRNLYIDVYKYFELDQII